MTVRRWLADLAWLPGQGLRRDVLIEAEGGRFTSVLPSASAAVPPLRHPSCLTSPP